MIDVHIMDVNTAPMGTTIKRTYNLSGEAVAQVRDLAHRSSPGTSQDRIVERAIERLYREAREHEETARWARASEDREFQAEMKALAGTYRDLESWPAE
jgi:hypothetical protein